MMLKRQGYRLACLLTLAILAVAMGFQGCSEVEVAPTSPTQAIATPANDSLVAVIDSLDHALCIARLMLRERTYQVNCYRDFITAHGLEVPPECSGHPLDPEGECGRLLQRVNP